MDQRYNLPSIYKVSRYDAKARRSGRAASAHLCTSRSDAILLRPITVNARLERQVTQRQCTEHIRLFPNVFTTIRASASLAHEQPARGLRLRMTQTCRKPVSPQKKKKKRAFQTKIPEKCKALPQKIVHAATTTACSVKVVKLLHPSHECGVHYRTSQRKHLSRTTYLNAKISTSMFQFPSQRRDHNGRIYAWHDGGSTPMPSVER